MRKQEKKKYMLAASIICANILNLEKEIVLLEKAKIDMIHFDVMDGDFVPRLGLHPEMLAAITSKTKIPTDIHMMVSNPEPYIPLFTKAGATYIVVHAESTKHLHRVIKLIKESGAKAGVALNIATPLSVLDYVLDDIDLVMLMAINPGIVGHKLIRGIFKKIVDLKAKLSEYQNVLIEIDGGVNPESAPEMIATGADIIVCGTQTIYRDGGVLANTKKIRKLIEEK